MVRAPAKTVSDILGVGEQVGKRGHGCREEWWMLGEGVECGMDAGRRWSKAARSKGWSI